MLVEGETGTNEANYNYDVKPIGLDKTLDIVYGVQTGYLTESSNYRDLFQSTITYTKELFGETSTELQSVLEAWKTIGLNDNLSTTNFRVEFTSLDNSFFHNFCEDETELSLEYEITNDGLQPFTSGTTIDIRYTINANTVGQREIILEEDLLPGSSINFEDQIDISNVQKYILLKINISSGDIDIDKEYNFVKTSSGKDLSLSYYNLSDVACTSLSDQYSLVFIRNESCKEIESGETAKLIFKNEKGEYTQDITFNTGILPNGNESIFLQLNEIPKDFGLFDIILKYDSDVNFDNNSLGGNIVGAIGQVTSATIFDFSDSSLNDMIQMDDNYAIDAQIVNYKDNMVLGYQGINQFNSFGIDCDDATDFFISQRTLASINFCVSLENFDQPAMKFDLTTIINETFPDFYSFPDNYYAIVQVMLDFSEFPIIIDQKNHETITHEIELPKGYTGSVKISILVIGSDIGSSSDIFDNNNWVLFDNIEFYDKKEVANKDIESSLFNVYPNPTTDNLSIIPLDQNTSYKIKFFDILGQKVGQDQFIGKLNYDISNFSSGTIFYQISEKGKIRTVGKVAIIN